MTPPPVRLVPFISQIADLAIRVLPQDVGMPVAIEVAGSDRIPARSRVGRDGCVANHAGPVHFPDRDLAVRIPQQDVGMAVVIEVAGSERRPARPRIGQRDRRRCGCSPSISQIETWPVLVFCQQDVGMAVVVEVAGSDRFPARAGIGARGPMANQRWSRSFPRSRLGRRVSATGCRSAVVIEIARSDRRPIRSGVAASGPTANQGSSRSFPRSRLGRSRFAKGCRNGRRH